MTLMEPFKGKGKNITTNNFFTLSLLAQELKRKTNLVEITNKVRHELLASAKCLQQHYSSKLMKAGDSATLTVYQCEPKKNICVLSSLHMSVELGKSEKKTKTVEFYNKMKYEVEVADQMARQYLVKAGTHRSVTHCCFLQHLGFGRHQCICAP